MNNDLIVIDAGHGGLDSGAVANGLEEKDLTLQASKYIERRLKELNVPVVMTREQDEYLPKKARIDRIRTITNNNPSTILISNHINAGGAEGAEVVYSLKNNSDFANLVLDKIGEKGQIKRKVYQRRLPENPNQDYYYILRESNSKEPILIEYGFIDNTKDREKLKENIEDYAEGVVEAITTYLGYPYHNLEQEEYIVQKGDTLYSISKKYNISVDELKRINNLTSNTLTIGQVLQLKEVGQTNNPFYIVQKGDTLYSIAKNNGISIEELIESNNLESSVLTIGQELYIPSASEVEIPEIEEKEYDIYTVQKGDSLWQISKKFQITVKELIELNNLEDLTLQINQQLLVPKQEEDIYIVQSGDTLWSIAKKYGITANQLQEINNLPSSLLQVGQQLKTK